MTNDVQPPKPKKIVKRRKAIAEKEQQTSPSVDVPDVVQEMAPEVTRMNTISFCSFMVGKLIYLLKLDVIFASAGAGDVYIDFTNMEGQKVNKVMKLNMHGCFMQNGKVLTDYFFDITKLVVRRGEKDKCDIPVSLALVGGELIMEVIERNYASNAFFIADSKVKFNDDAVSGFDIGENEILKNYRLYTVTLENFKNSQYHIREDTLSRIVKLFEHFGAVQIKYYSWRFSYMCFFSKELGRDVSEVHKYQNKEYFNEFLKRRFNDSAHLDRYNSDKQFYFIMNNAHQEKVSSVLNALKKCDSKLYLNTQYENICFYNPNQHIIYDLATQSEDSYFKLPHFPTLMSRTHLRNIEPMILKPNGVRLFSLLFDCIAQNNLENNYEICGAHQFRMSDDMIKHFYPNCASRPYGPDWYEYLKSGDCLLLWIRTANYKELRNLALDMRSLSHMEFTRNVNHTAENESEQQIFGVFIQKFLPDCVVPVV